MRKVPVEINRPRTERLLQWGRTFSSAERSLRRPSADGADERFNGAALFQVRKVDRHIERINRIIHASMGPHFFKCGKIHKRLPYRSIHLSFNGAALFQVRKGPSGIPLGKRKRKLQWGRTFSSAESPLGRGKGKDAQTCFNGAALFQVRKGRGGWDGSC